MNVLLNCEEEEVELGSLLEEFKDFTKDFDPVVSSALVSSCPRRPSKQMRGLAIAQSTKLREAHNSMARSVSFVLGPRRGNQS